VFINSLQPDDLVAIYEGVIPNSSSIWLVGAIPTDHGTYYAIPVTPYPSTGQALPALNDNPVDVHLLERREHKLYDEHVHTDVDSSLPLEQRHLLAWNALGKFSADFRMNWRGNWQAIEYQKHDVVLDSPYTMVANKVTTDRAAPQPIGNASWDLPDQPLWTYFSNTSVVGSGHSYLFSETVYVNSLRVFPPVIGENITYRLTTILDGSVSQRELTTLSGNQWNILGVDPVLVGAGSTLLVYLEALNSGGSTIVTGGWTRGINSNLEPANASWNQNVQRTILRIDFDDLDTADRQSELEGIVVGSTIQIVETAVVQNSITYQVLNPPVTGATSVSYDVVVIDEGVTLPTVGETCTITADVPVPQATDFVGIVDGWVGNQPIYATASSYLAFDGVNQGADPDNQYGVSINVQRIEISDDWDVLALSGSAGGGGSQEANLQGYLGEAFPTGLYDGGELNIVAAGLNIEVVAGAGVVMDSYTDPLSIPTRVNLSWATQDQVITSVAATGNIAWFTMADGGVGGVIPETNLGILIERDIQPTPAQMRDEVFLGFAIYDGSVWGEVSTPITVNNAVHTLTEYVRSINTFTYIESGGAVHEAASFKLDQDAGVLWEQNRNWHVNKKDPNREALPQRLGFQWKYINRDMTIVSALTDTVDPANYDDGVGIVPVGGSALTTTIQRVYLDPRDNYWVLYGQNLHDNFMEGLADIGHDTTNTVVPLLPAKSILLGYIVTERNQADWQEEHAEFVTVAQGSAGGGGASITTYDDLTDTPSSKIGSALKFPQVNALETAHEYVLIDYSDIQNPPVGGTLWGGSLAGDIWNLNSGDVGIGTTTPDGKLNVSVSSTELIGKFSATSHNAALYISSANTSLIKINSGANTDPAIGKHLTLATANAERVRITATGDIGVGTTLPDTKLNLWGNVHFENGGTFPDKTADYQLIVDTYQASPNHGTGGSGTMGGLNVQAGWSNQDIPVVQFSGLTTGFAEVPVMTVLSSGKVGIGTTAPDCVGLHVVATDSAFAPTTNAPLFPFVIQRDLNCNTGIFSGLDKESRVQFGQIANGFGNSARIGVLNSVSPHLYISVSNVKHLQVENNGGITVPPTVTGGSQGAGTINVSGGYYVNGVPIGGGISPTEGSFTPTLEGVSYSPVTGTNGWYFRIGRMVTCTGRVRWTALNNADTSGATIGGLPFNVANGGSGNTQGGGHCPQFNGIDTTGSSPDYANIKVGLVGQVGFKSMAVYGSRSASDPSPVTGQYIYTSFATAGWIEFTMTYFTDD
jgi:hypothetical protein